MGLEWTLGMRREPGVLSPRSICSDSLPRCRTSRSRPTSPRSLVTVVPSRRQLLNNQSFPRQKQPGTYRIVCLGGSATYGRPFFDHTSFCGLAPGVPAQGRPVAEMGGDQRRRDQLRQLPRKGLTAELAEYEPDLFVAYMGHNEFLECRTYAEVFDTPGLIRNAAGLASWTRLASVTRAR